MVVGGSEGKLEKEIEALDHRSIIDIDKEVNLRRH